jgi:hypothetical protein
VSTIAAIAVLISSSAWVNDRPTPSFEKYPATQIFSGKPAQPILRDWREFRTRIREGAKTGPNFAGHLTIVRWGCGTACVVTVFVDAVTGMIFQLPFGSMTTHDFVIDEEVIEAKRDSRLLVVRGCPGEKLKKCGTYYFLWREGEGFEKLQYAPGYMTPTPPKSDENQ